MGKRRNRSNERYEFDWNKGIIVVILWLVGAQKEVGYEDAVQINTIKETLKLEEIGEIKVKDIHDPVYANLSFFEVDWLRRKLKEQFDDKKVPVSYTSEAVPLFEQLDHMSDYLVDGDDGEDDTDDDGGDPVED